MTIENQINQEFLEAMDAVAKSHTLLKVGVLGIGNTGNQIAALAYSKGIENVLAINSSEKDLNTVRELIPTLLIGDSKGAGKDRNQSKDFIKKSIGSIIKEKHLDIVCEGMDIVFLVTSADGGTGSGMTPILQAVLPQVYPNVLFIPAGVMPTMSESMAAHQNSIEWLKEIKISNPTYLLYDNGKYEDRGTEMFSLVNNDVVDDMVIIAGSLQKDTPYSSIDERDSMKMYSTRGRLVVGRVTNVSEKDIEAKSIETRILDQIKLSAHTELQYDKVLRRRGLIINLNERLNKTVDRSLIMIRETFGEPVESFEHLVIDNDIKENSVAMIFSGLSFPDDRIEKSMTRISEIKNSFSETKVSILDGIDLGSIADLRREDDAPKMPTDIDELIKLF